MMILVALAAAHEGEEFVIALPAVMLAAAFFIMRWANQKDEEDEPDRHDDEQDVEADVVGSGANNDG